MKKIFYWIIILTIILNLQGCGFSIDKNTEYFPTGIFHKDNKSNDSFISDWYTKQLNALQEPSLFKLKTDKNANVYRFLYLRSFHKPISIRIEINLSNKSAMLFYKRCNGAGGGKPGIIDEDKKFNLNEVEISRLINMIDNERFWSLPSTENDIGIDGAKWVVEGVSKGNYHLVDRFSPKKGSIRNIGLLFLELAKVKIDNNELY